MVASCRRVVARLRHPQRRHTDWDEYPTFDECCGCRTTDDRSHCVSVCLSVRSFFRPPVTLSCRMSCCSHLQVHVMDCPARAFLLLPSSRPPTVHGDRSVVSDDSEVDVCSVCVTFVRRRLIHTENLLTPSERSIDRPTAFNGARSLSLSLRRSDVVTPTARRSLVRTIARGFADAFDVAVKIIVHTPLRAVPPTTHTYTHARIRPHTCAALHQAQRCLSSL